jgi:hypothetical protein
MFGNKMPQAGKKGILGGSSQKALGSHTGLHSLK